MIVAGVGFSSRCAPEELAQLVRRAQAAADLVPTGLAAPAWKARSPCLQRAAQLLGLPILPIDRDQLAGVVDRVVSHSAASHAVAGVGSAAEAAALAAAGPRARLALPRIASAYATCALAEGEPA